MRNRKKQPLLCMLALAIAVILVLPTGITTAAAVSVLPATVQPRDSNLIERASITFSSLGDGEILLEYSVSCTDVMDVLGYFSIALYESTDNENWTHLTTYHWTVYPEMMGYDFSEHSGWFRYQGVEGRYYRALGAVYAGSGSDYQYEEFYSDSHMAN